MSTIDAQPPEILIRIITIVLSANIRAVASLAVNKHIHALVDELWPKAARRQLQYIQGMLTAHYSHQALLNTIMDTHSVGVFRYITLNTNAKDRHVGCIFGIEPCSISIMIDVVTRDYVVTFVVNKFGLYVPHRYYHRGIVYPYASIYQFSDIDPTSSHSMIHRTNTKYLMSKLLPEIIHLFDFGI